MKLQEWRNRICENSFLNELYPLYAGRAAEGAERLLGLLDYFNETFGPEGDISLFSAPGRTEIGGNHTDHQHGCVLAASVNLDTVAAARPVSENRIRIQSEGYPLCEISTDDLAVHPEEKNTTISLIRGIAARFSQEGCPVKGFDAVVRSDVLPGSGLSSSAAFEVLVGNIINSLFFGNRLDAVRIAQFAQYAENVYFGKPSGLMDQMASSIGNILTIDFEDTEKPLVRRLDVDFEKTGLALCIIDTGADHADLTDEYAAIPLEMKKVCACFGREYLRQIPEKTFMEELPRVRTQVGDRAILRAFHIYEDNRRAVLEAEALEKGDLDRFLSLVRKSGESSWTQLQNITPAGYTRHQEMAFTLAVCSRLLKERGAWRVHGGGFAGTVQAFVPGEMLETFKEETERIIGKGSCHVLSIRSAGGVRI